MRVIGQLVLLDVGLAHVLFIGLEESQTLV